MYNKILVTVDATPTDRVILDHVKALAIRLKSRVVFLHVADGWAARTFGPDAVSPEISEDRAYLDALTAEFAAAGISSEAELAYGEPSEEIIKWIETKQCDLVGMSTHGHRFLEDIFYGATADKVRHKVDVPVLLLRARR